MLILRALVARDALPVALRAAGIAVDITAAYETRPVQGATLEKLASDFAAQQIDVVTLTSSSTARELVAALGPQAPALLAKSVVAAIGPITAETARELGVRVDVVAEAYTMSGLLDALERHFTVADPT